VATWKLEDAKNQFSKLVQWARQYGPQVVTRHGREEVVVLPIEQYRKLTRKQGDLVTFMRESPLADALAAGELKLTRSRDLPRELPL